MDSGETGFRLWNSVLRSSVTPKWTVICGKLPTEFEFDGARSLRILAQRQWRSAKRFRREFDVELKRGLLQVRIQIVFLHPAIQSCAANAKFFDDFGQAATIAANGFFNRPAFQGRQVQRRWSRFRD